MEIEHTRTENEQQAHQELRRGLGARPFVALCSPALLLFRLQVLEDAREPTHVHCDLLKLGFASCFHLKEALDRPYIVELKDPQVVAEAPERRRQGKHFSPAHLGGPRL